MKWQNDALPGPERSGVEGDERASLAHVVECIASLRRAVEAEDKQCDAGVVNGLFRALTSHSKLKYELPLDDHVEVVALLERGYEVLVVPTPQRSKMLHMLKSLLRKRTVNLEGKWEFTRWRPLWDEALSLVMRANKQAALSSEAVLSSHATHIVDYLHVARRFMPPHQQQGQGQGQGQALVDEMVTAAMEHLRDTRVPSCLFGLVSLVACLPTDYARYDEMLPSWVAIWSSIDHNAYWDSCWLTLLTRARKHTKTFDWSQLSALFFAKTRQLLHLPVVRGQVPTGSDFPNAFPAYMIKMMPCAQEPSKVALHKLAKLLYFLTLDEAPVATAVRPTPGLVLSVPTTLTPASLRASRASPSQSSTRRRCPTPATPPLPSSAQQQQTSCSSCSPSESTSSPSNSGAWTPRCS